MRRIEKSGAIATLFSLIQYMPISEEARQFISDNIKVVEVKSNALLHMPGAICSNLYFVVHGGFVCRYFNKNSETPKTINFYLNELHPFMACVDSYFTQQPSSCELRAIKDSVVLSMSKEKLDLLLQSNPDLQQYYYNLVTQALVEENELKLKIISYSIEELYEYLRNELPVVIQKVPSKYIAEFMGISAEWLSKVKRKRK